MTQNLAGNILWTPKEFKFSNMFSYGEDNLIRFDKAQGIMGILPPNASGKSSMWDVYHSVSTIEQVEQHSRGMF